MHRRNPWIYLIGGAICATAAVLVAVRFMPRQNAGQGEMFIAEARLLMAASDIEFGTPLVLKTGDQEGNVGFAPWPKDRLPQGAITKEEEVKDRKLIALATFVRHEPILLGEVIGQERFVPDGQYLQMVEADPAQIKTEEIKPGMRVDVVKVVGNRHREFIRGAPVYAVGHLSYREDGGENDEEAETPPYVYLLLPKGLILTFADAKLQYQLKLLPSFGEQPDGPTLVAEEGETAIEKAMLLLEAGRGLAQEQRYEEAAVIFQVLTEKYSAQEVAETARAELVRCCEAMAQQVLARARAALEQGETQECLSVLTSAEARLAAAPAALKAIGGLRVEAEKKLRREQSQRDYIELLAEMDRDLERGNFEGLDSALNKMAENFTKDEFNPPEGKPAPDQAQAKYRDKLESRRREFRVKKMAFDNYLGQQNWEKAAIKCLELRRMFPDHPFVLQAEKALLSRGREAIE